MSLFHILLINVGALITAFGGIFLKQLSADLDATSSNFMIRLIMNEKAWLGGLCYIVPIGIWTYILRTVELTKLQPMLSIVYVYTVGLAFLVLNERASALRLTGIALIVVGVIIVGKS